MEILIQDNYPNIKQWKFNFEGKKEKKKKKKKKKI